MSETKSWLGDVLKEVSLFDGFDDAMLRKIFESGKVEKYGTGEMLIAEQSACARILVMVDGKARVSRRTGQGEERVLAYLSRGSVIGEMSAFDGLGHSADVYAEEPLSVLAIDKQKFFGLLRKDADLALKITTRIISTLSMRLRKTNEQLMD
jgi:CRP/FNR family cyclic AMP-dependent transcriptional regulator